MAHDPTDQPVNIALYLTKIGERALLNDEVPKIDALFVLHVHAFVYRSNYGAVFQYPFALTHTMPIGTIQNIDALFDKCASMHKSQDTSCWVKSRSSICTSHSILLFYASISQCYVAS